MRIRLANWVKSAVIAAALCALLGVPTLARQDQSSGQQQTGDAVADAARKAREKQKTATKPKKVYTEDDIPARLGGDAAATATTNGGSATNGQAAGTAQPAGANPQGTAAGTAGDNPKPEDPETMWRKRFQKQRDKIAQAEQELDVLQRESDKSQLQYYSDPQKAMQEQNSRKDITDKNAKIEAKKQEIATLKQQLSDMEDELRKSGGDIGWSR